MIYRKQLIFFLLACTTLITGCLKTSDSLIQKSEPIKFEGDNLLKTLSSIDSLSLFYLAVKRLGYADLFETNNNYTVFAPRNAAMIAKGLDSVGMGEITGDSLRKLIGYHLLPGAFASNALESPAYSQLMETLRADTSFVPGRGYTITGSSMYVQEGDSLYLNDYPCSGNEPPVMASNGYIYPINKLVNYSLTNDNRTMWDVISSDPDLSLYYASIQLLDSLRRTEPYIDEVSPDYSPILLSDSALFAARKIREDGYINSQKTPMLLAPTNTAFSEAGFNTIDDIRNFALRSSYGVSISANEDFTQYSIKESYTALDTLLLQHLLYNDSVPDFNLQNPIRILYSDLVKGKVNNGILNKRLRDLTESKFLLYLRYSWDLQFSQDAGIAYVQWYPGSPKVMIPRDDDPLTPKYNYVLENGTIYKIDKLFYPFQ